MSRRLCFALDLVNDAAKIAEYERFHAPGGVWPQIVDDIHAQGIEGMEIWRTGDRMVMIATVVIAPKSLTCSSSSTWLSYRFFKRMLRKQAYKGRHLRRDVGHAG